MGLLMASCSNDEAILTPEKQAIGFGMFVDKVSRADVASKDNISQISVFGFIDNTATRNFDRVRVSKQANGTWTYSPLQYWVAGKSYYFMAFTSPALATNTTQMTYSWPAETTTPAGDFYGVGKVAFNNEQAHGAEDILFATQTAQTPATISTAPPTVDFTFKHMLSRVHFTFTNGMGTNGYSMKVTNLKIDNATATGDFVLGAETPSWENLDGQFALVTPMPENTFGNGNKGVSDNVFVIPCVSTYTISFDVELYLNNNLVDTYTHSAKALPQTELLCGYSYNFAATLNASNIDPENELFPIVFTVTDVTPWEENAPEVPFMTE